MVAVVFLLIGGIGAILLGADPLAGRPPAHAEWYYRILTLHGLNMLIFWILNFEIAILYFAGTGPAQQPTLLEGHGLGLLRADAGRRCHGRRRDHAGRSDVLMTSYVPLKASPWFYLGIILVAVGTLIGVINFLFATVYIAKRDHTYEGSVPLVVFGAIAAAIIAVVTLLHGAVVMIPTWLWSMGVIAQIDPGGTASPGGASATCRSRSTSAPWWRLVPAGHTHGRRSKPSTRRSAAAPSCSTSSSSTSPRPTTSWWIPGVGAGWKIWNTSYAMYLAVLASMIHGFTVPASIEVGHAQEGLQPGPLRLARQCAVEQPGFSGFFLSLVIFGFGGGITGVVLGTQQINIMAHNTCAFPGTST